MTTPAPKTEGVQVIGRPLIRVASTPSTMDLAAELAAHGAGSGTVVLAGHQTAGRGRAGRTWQADPWSSILMSFLYETRRRQPSLGLLAPALGLAVTQTIDRWLPGQAQVKWPNDVLIGERKIAGLLVSARQRAGEQVTSLVCGTGFNVTSTPGGLSGTGTCLARETGHEIPLDTVLAVLLEEISAVLDRFERRDDGELVADLRERLAFIDQAVSVLDGSRTVAGVVCGLDPAGALLLDRGDGRTIRVVAGDVVRGPRRQCGSRR